MHATNSGPPDYRHGKPDDLRIFISFQHFEESAVARLASLGTYETVEPGDVLFSEGEENQDFFVVLSGAVAGHRDTPVGRQALGDLRAGGIFGEISFFDLQPRPATVTCSVPGLLLRFPAEECKRLTGRHHSLQVSLLRSFWNSLSLKLRLANQAMIETIGARRMLPRQGVAHQGAAADVSPAAKIEVFKEKGMTAAELRLLAATIPTHRWEPGQFIFVEGQEADAMYIVLDGEVRISRRIPNMGEEALAILGHGEVFGEMALIDDQRRSADAIAHDQGCTLLVLHKADTEEIFAMRSAAALQFLHLMCEMQCQRLRSMIKMLANWRMMVGHE